MSKQRITGGSPTYTAPRERYGKRTLAKGVELLEDTKVTGLNNNVLVIGNSGCGKTGSYICSVLKTSNHQSYCRTSRVCSMICSQAN